MLDAVRVTAGRELKPRSLPGSFIQPLQPALPGCLGQPWLLAGQTVQTLQTKRAPSRNMLQHFQGYSLNPWMCIVKTGQQKGREIKLRVSAGVAPVCCNSLFTSPHYSH